MGNTQDKSTPDEVTPFDGDASEGGVIVGEASEQVAAELSEQIETNVATEATEIEGEVDEKPVVNPCPKCGVGRDLYPVCRACGFYELLNTFVEIDASMESDEYVAEEPPFKLPLWAYALAGILLAIFIESLVAAFLLPANSVARMWWSLTQLFIGLGCLIAGQLRAAFLSTMDNSDGDISDCIMKPLRVWPAVTSRLPGSFGWLAAASGGLLAVVMSLTVIRSIPYHKLWETDAPPPKASNALGQAIADHAANAESDLTMEEALNEFSGQAIPTDEPEEEELAREFVECVILGFFAPDVEDAELSSIVVGSVVDKKLEVLGTVGLGLDEVRTDLHKALLKIVRPTPFVETSQRATWVEPKVLCQISLKRSESGIVSDLRFEKAYGITNKLVP